MTSYLQNLFGRGGAGGYEALESGTARAPAPVNQSTGTFGRISGWMGGTSSDATEAEPSEFAELCNFELSWTERLYGFAICFGIGTLMSLMSTLALSTLNLRGFATLYTLGNVVSLIGTGFLTGFVRQIKTMFDSNRAVASAVYLGSLTMTLISAFVIRSVILTLLFVIIQFGAMCWYSLSYIPGARSVVAQFVGVLFNRRIVI